jgi:hypothetical protein
MALFKSWIVALIALHCCIYSSAKSCKNSDLFDKVEASKSLQQTGKKSWAIVCLLRSTNRNEYTRRNKALAAALLPFANKHDFTILMFSEDSFPKSELDGWRMQFKGVGDVKFIDVNSKANHLPQRFGYKWMCKFFTVDLYEYITQYDYYLRVDSDNIVIPPVDNDYDMFSWVENNNVEYGYVIRKFEPHKETRDTLPSFVSDYVVKCEVKPLIQHPVLTTLFNFYNNLHAAKVSFFLRPDVRHFMVATNTSGKLHA